MRPSLVTVGFAALLTLAAACRAALITFDEVIQDETSYAYDGDGDEIDDVVFSTSDPAGFNTAGPGPDMNFIAEPGIEGTTALGVDLRVDFTFGASSNISFGFAMSTTQETHGVTFELYDHNGSLIGSTSQGATFESATVKGAFPEAVLSLDFNGIAVYGLFKFDEAPQRYIIDNFRGAFGSRPEAQPAVITGFTIAPEGVIIEWIPVVGLDSVVKWSCNLPYIPFASTSATLPYPQHSYTDTVHRVEGQCFYRVDLMQ